MKNKLLIGLITATLLTACGKKDDSTTPVFGEATQQTYNEQVAVTQQQQAPVQQAQQKSEGFDWGAAAIGAAVGYAASNMLGGSNNQPANNHVYQDNSRSYQQPTRRVAPDYKIPDKQKNLPSYQIPQQKAVTLTPPTPSKSRIGSALIAPSAPSTPKPVTAPARPSYGVSGYSSVRQSAPSYRPSTSSFRSSGRR